MKIVHTVNSLRADHGGPSRSVTALCSALAERGANMEIVTHRQGLGEEAAVTPNAPVPVHFVEREHGVKAFMPGKPAFSRAVEQAAGESGIVHDHGLWLPSNHAAARAARQARRPFVVSVRGMLAPWPLSQSRAKKRVGWALYQRRDLRSATLFHATAEQEAEDVRRVGLRQPVALIPNGVDLPERYGTDRPEGEVRHALFLSRLHPKKGLVNLVQAWAQVRPEGWELVLAGPDADGHRAEVEQAVSELGITGSVRFTGPVGDEGKWDLYHSADLFVLPTFSENFGIVVAEALAAGLPVITTKGAPWQDLETHDCGWWIDIGVEPLARALAEATGLSDERRRMMGQRGRALVEEKYSWSHVADEMSAVYSWLLGHEPRPDCIV